MRQMRPFLSRETLSRRIAQAKGDEPADCVIKNVQLLSLFTGALIKTDIAITDDTIVGTHGVYRGRREFDGEGCIAVPGFIDTHVHIESSLVTPPAFERCVMPHGTTTVICDPHEIANVAGVEGLNYFLDSATAANMSIFVALSSCVPATEMETSGARLEADALKAFVNHPATIGLAEFMNFPGVIHQDTKALDKLSAFSSGHIDGHAPLLSGLNLNAYLAAGIRTDHECSSLKEAQEKLEKGMTILIREGSVSKDLNALIPLINADTSSRLAFCTDDRNPLDIAEEGHIDAMIRRAIAHGAPLHHVYRIATLSGASAFNLMDRGLIAPAYKADIVLLDRAEDCSINRVFIKGQPLEEILSSKTESPEITPPAMHSVKLPKLTNRTFEDHRDGHVSVIVVDPGKIITRRLDTMLAVDDKGRCVDLERDIVKVAVIERHGKNGNVALGFVQGFSLKKGAIASSIGHDSHNLCVIGVHNDDMRLAAERVSALQGGFVVVHEGAILAELALPVAGLMSPLDFNEIKDALIELRHAAKALGCTLPEPFLQIGFLPLPVIPHLKLTDKGLVDVDKFALIERFAER